MPVAYVQLARLIGESGAGKLDENELQVVTRGEFGSWSDIRDWHEIALATLEAIARYDTPGDGARVLAQGTLDRFREPDRATPYADLRVQIEKLKKREQKFVRAIEDLCDLIRLCDTDKRGTASSVAFRRAEKLIHEAT